MHKLYTAYTVTLSALATGTAAASAWVILNTDPAQGPGTLALFYASTGGFVLAAAALAMYLIRAKLGLRERIKRHFYVSLRQGLWVAVLFAASMYLQSAQLFSWMSSGLLVVALIFLESYFLNNERESQPDQG